MKWVLIGAVSFATMSAAAEPVSVASGNWSDIPAIAERGDLRIGNGAIDELKAAAKQASCPAIGTYRRLNISVPFLVEFTPQGAVHQVVIQRINCPTIEAILGGTVLQLTKAGEYRATGENDAGWYRGEIKLIEQ